MNKRIRKKLESKIYVTVMRNGDCIIYTETSRKYNKKGKIVDTQTRVSLRKLDV